MKLNLHFSNSAALLTIFLAGACQSTKPLLSATPRAAIHQRLPALEISADAGPLAASEGMYPEDPLHQLRNELQNNVVEPTDSATFGFMRLVVTQGATHRTNKGYQALQMVTLLTPSLFGVPLETYKTDLVAELQVTDARGNLLGTYTGSGHSSVRVAMYYGYAQQHAPRLADVLALRDAMAHIRPQLDTAAERLRPLLLARGPVDNPTLPTGIHALAH